MTGIPVRAIDAGAEALPMDEVSFDGGLANSLSRQVLEAASDPALGEDRMVRLGDVLDLVRSGAIPREGDIAAPAALHIGMTYREAEAALNAGMAQAIKDATVRAIVEHFAPCSTCGGSGVVANEECWDGDPETAPDAVDCPTCAAPTVQPGLAVDAVVPVKVAGFLVGVDEHASTPRVLVRVTACSGLPHLVGATLSVAEWKVRPR